MSFHYDNVIWRSPNGTWNAGFFAEDYLTCGGNDEECGDETHEWCREFDQNTFQFVSGGHKTEDEAHRAWPGSNPGSTTVYCDGDWIASFEDMAARLCEREAKREKRGYGYGMSTHGYYGPARSRKLPAVQKELNSASREALRYRLSGYANLPSSEIPDLTAKVDSMYAAATPTEREAFDATDKEFRNDLRTMLKDHRDQRAAEARRSASFWGGYRPGAASTSAQKDANEKHVEVAIADLDTAAAKRTARFAAAPSKQPPPAKRTMKRVPPVGVLPRSGAYRPRVSRWG